MKIAICWAHWVWKTTISKIISEEFSLKILPDIVVDAYKMWLEINENTPIETQVWLVGKQFENEKINNDFVADKCIFDYYVYADVLWMDKDVVEMAKKIALKTYNYDYIFYINPEFPIEDDWIRSTNIEFQKWIDTFYEKFLIDNNIPFKKITWSIEERKKQIINSIKM